MAPVKAPFSWPNSSLSSSPVGMAAQLSLTKVRLSRGTQLVQGAGDEFLARARFATNEHRGAGGGDRLHLLQHPVQGGALADDLAEVVLGADLLLQVGILLGELVLERLDLLEGQGVLDRHGHLIGDELQEAHVRRIVGGRLLAREHQRAHPPPGGGQRKKAAALASIYGCTAFQNRGQRLSSATLEMMSGCWVCHTNPAGSSSTGRAITGGSGVGSEASRTCRRMVLVAASCRTRAR